MLRNPFLMEFQLVADKIDTSVWKKEAIFLLFNTSLITFLFYISSCKNHRGAMDENKYSFKLIHKKKHLYDVTALTRTCCAAIQLKVSICVNEPDIEKPVHRY